MRHLGDITKIRGDQVPPVNVMIGGSPCQDLSIAGKREGLAGERSGLFMEQLRVIKEMRCADIARGRTGRDIRPRWMVWENVPGAFSSNKGQDFAAVLHETVKIVCPEAPPIPVPDGGGMAHKRLSRWRGRTMEPCVASSRCTVLGSPPTSPSYRTYRRFWRLHRLRNTLCPRGPVRASLHGQNAVANLCRPSWRGL